MIINKIKNNDVLSLTIDESEEIKEIVPLTYVISVEHKEEYDNGIDLLITRLLLHNIKVYHYMSSTQTLEYSCNKILASNNSIIYITTYNEDKFKLLENIIKEFMIDHKNDLI